MLIQVWISNKYSCFPFSLSKLKGLCEKEKTDKQQNFPFPSEKWKKK